MMRIAKKRILLGLFLSLFFISPFIENGEIHQTSEKERGKDDKTISESWMGIYMEGVKVGYSHNLEGVFFKEGKEFTRSISESWMRVSRLGGAPVEIKSAQESLYRDDEIPVETVIRTKMSESEIVMKAEIQEGKILFKSGENLVKELTYSEKFYLGIPVDEIAREGSLKPGRTFTFRILDPLSRSITDSSFEVIGKEDVLILGQVMNLWHVRTEMISIIPVVMDEWIDDQGAIWKSVSKASFMTTTSIRMPKEKALEMSEENLDIAFSTIIHSNVIFENPVQVRKVTFKLSGIPLETIEKFPFDDGSQVLVETKEEFALVQTVSQIFKEEEAISFPVEDENFQDYLVTTSFCQSNDPEIVETAQEIVGEEQNAWKAAKKIALWVSREMTPNYDVGFATASEILKNREGDCSEHTVIAVALCRAVGIPARAAVGIMYANGIFAYHMWPEVYVGRWIGLDAKWMAVDAETGEYYTDATHLKFGRSSLDENIFEEMVQAISEIIGKLKLEIIDYHQEEQIPFSL
ncbi:MAG: transglutaminase domain-containing protein [Candidatus Aminicenantes bacterium]|nr:transglutaminase domain-containing protein [Candidatus Aminicenantes bacterium]MDH5745185.1 transglutaminase domain-containing protein [Candidatus Aminicenantes bacterium]